MRLTSKTAGINATVAPEQESAKDRLGEQVKDTVEDCFRIRRNDVATLTNAPSDRVQEPKKNGENAGHEVHFGDVCA